MKSLSLILAVGVLVSGCYEKRPTATPPPAEVTAFRVTPKTIPADFSFVGVAKSSHPVEIRSRVEGYLWNIEYTEGSLVKEGAALFQIDPRPFEASLMEAQGELARQEAILWRAKRSLERIQPLYSQNAVSLRDLDDATAQVLAAEASVISAKANVIQAELNLSFTHITSPIEGLTGRAVFKEGTLITPTLNGLLTLVSVIDPIWVLFTISDNELLQAQNEESKTQLILPETENFTVKLNLADGSEFPHLGTVNFKSPTLDPETGSLVVRGTFPNPEKTLLPGQFVKATVMGAQRPGAIFIPKQAVSQGQKGAFVFCLDQNNKASIRYVDLGEWYKNYWIITGGLKTGDVVVVDGVNKIQEGSSVKITNFLFPEEK